MSTVAVLNIRPATVADAGLILHFIRELAIYEKAEHSVQTDEIGIAESLFGADATARALICEADGEDEEDEASSKEGGSDDKTPSSKADSAASNSESPAPSNASSSATPSSLDKN